MTRNLLTMTSNYHLPTAAEYLAKVKQFNQIKNNIMTSEIAAQANKAAENGRLTFDYCFDCDIKQIIEITEPMKKDYAIRIFLKPNKFQKLPTPNPYFIHPSPGETSYVSFDVKIQGSL